MVLIYSLYRKVQNIKMDKADSDERISAWTMSFVKLYKNKKIGDLCYSKNSDVYYGMDTSKNGSAKILIIFAKQKISTAPSIIRSVQVFY